MDIRIFDLPTKDADISVIESTYCALKTKYRNGEPLDEVEFNWMDTANNWLITTESKR